MAKKEQKETGKMPWDNVIDLNYYPESRTRRIITTYKVCGISREVVSSL
jgi:hypothetical protein